MGEIAKAFKLSGIRDQGLGDFGSSFGNKNKISLVKPIFDQIYPDTN